MKKTIALFILVLLTITACGPIYETQHTYFPPETMEGKQCVNHCLNGKTQCETNCQSAYSQCINQARQLATIQYNAYVVAQKLSKDPVDKTINDFTDNSHCRKSCNCQSDYRQCYQNCGGTVLSQQICVTGCDKS